MGSTGESHKKRRQLSAISPADTKHQSMLLISEDKKLNKTVLQYQNQKLSETLEAQKIEITSLVNKFDHQRVKQKQYDKTLTYANLCWKKLVDNLESSSVRTRCTGTHKATLVVDDGLFSFNDAFIRRLVEAGATECCSTNEAPQDMVENEKQCSKKQNILQNIVSGIDEIWCFKDGLYAALSTVFPENGKNTTNDLLQEVKNVRLAFSDLHLKHRAASKEMHYHQDVNVKDKVERERLKGELELANKELEETNHEVAALKAEKDATKGAFFPVLNRERRSVADERAVDKKREVQDMESSLKELMDQSSSRLLELERLLEGRIDILKKLANLQSILKSVKCISSSQPIQLLREQLEKSKVEFNQYQLLFEKLQAEKDSLAWREQEANFQNELDTVYRRTCFVAESRISQVGDEIRILIDERRRIEAKMEDSLREPGRMEIVSKFKVLVSSFPENMNTMQSQLSKYKEAAKDTHSLRADAWSLTNILSRKKKELESLYTKCSVQETEMQRLQTLVWDLKENEMELELFLEMYRRESTISRGASEARDSEYRAWAHAHSLKSSLDEQNIVLRVKKSIEAEAISQQRLAAAEAEIADLRPKWEASKREESNLTDSLKAKNEEIDAYFSELETIGQAYDDMRNQNHHLLQQITERDDYNIKLVVEGARSILMNTITLGGNQIMEQKILQATISRELFEVKATRLEEQVKMYTEAVQRLAEERSHTLITSENIQKRLLDARSSREGRDCLEALQSRVKEGQVNLAGMQGELETKRFEKRRLQEDLEAARVKAGRLKAQREGSAVEKLWQELQKYRELVKCSICLDRAKEVVLTKCYHLFCNHCVQGLIESRHRKCPICGASFGPNDVKPVYI